MLIVEIFKEDLELQKQEVEFHWFHRWSKWYRITLDYSQSGAFCYIKQERCCLTCGKRQQSEIRNAS